MQCSAVLCCFARLSARKPPAVIFANLRRRGRHVAAIKAGHRHKRPPAAHGLHRRRDGNAHLARPPHTPAPAGPPGQAIETKDGRDSGTPSETRVMVLHSVHGSSSCDMNTVLGGNGGRHSGSTKTPTPGGRAPRCGPADERAMKACRVVCSP